MFGGHLSLVAMAAPSGVRDTNNSCYFVTLSTLSIKKSFETFHLLDQSLALLLPSSSNAYLIIMNLQLPADASKTCTLGQNMQKM